VVNTAIIVAAGEGQRLGTLRPKQFLDLCGEPMLVHTLRAFDHCADVDEVILVLAAEERDAFAGGLSAFNLKKVSRVVAGGSERQDSVWQGLHWVDSARTEIVAVHDGVRPLVTPEQISRVLAQARRSGAATLAIPVTDTIKEVEGAQVMKTLDRRRLYLVQTPQAFRTEILVTAYQRARAEGRRATDDAALVEQCGLAVAVVEGSRENMKITWPEDLALAEFLLKRRQP
jgi:2-C-methyl-D-erythritol 4-phosphate cytidylyltransferase